MVKGLSVIVLIALLSACASNPPAVIAHKPVAVPPMLKSVPFEWNKSNLLDFHDKWKGTPYRLGGLSKKGIDCSGFIYLAYLDIVGGKLPRTVNEQRMLGKQVARDQLMTGDLVFFKTGSTMRHVGIYISQDRFLHVSTKKGVKISSLNNIYWKPRYWFAKRLKKPTEQQIVTLVGLADVAQ